MTPAFTISQSPVAPNLVVAADTSTSPDGAVTQRRIYIQKADGIYLVPVGVTTDYVQWPLADSSISLDILTSDAAVSITVQWLDVSNGVLYTLTQLFCLAQFNQQFLYYLVGLQALSPKTIIDNNYFSNMATYWINIIGAIKAIEIGADISASQNCLNRATFMKDNESKFF